MDSDSSDTFQNCNEASGNAGASTTSQPEPRPIQRVHQDGLAVNHQHARRAFVPEMNHEPPVSAPIRGAVNTALMQLSIGSVPSPAGSQGTAALESPGPPRPMTTGKREMNVNRAITRPEATMAAAAIFFALSLPLMTMANAHTAPFQYAAVARAMNGIAMMPAALLFGKGKRIPWQRLARKPRAPMLLPILGTQALALPAITIAAQYVTPTVIACILATYPIALVFLGWVATKGTPHPRPLNAKTIVAAAVGIGGAMLAITGQAAPPHATDTGILQSTLGLGCALAASLMIGMNAFSARFGIQNTMKYQGNPDDRSSTAIATAAIGATGLASALPIAVTGLLTEAPPTAPELGLAALNGITISAAYCLWISSTLRTRSLGAQVITYGEPLGALAILAAAGLAPETNWLTLGAGMTIVIAAGLTATIPNLRMPARRANR